jgi:hypothetical protein
MKKKIILLIASSLLILSCEEQIFVIKDINHTSKTVKQYVFLTFFGKYLILNLEILIITKKYGVVTIKMEYGRCKQHNNWKYW